MKSSFNLIGFIILFAWAWMLNSEMRSLRSKNDQDLKGLQTEIANIKESAPGLGEFMTTMQLHMGKLWFPAKASNWELAKYELDELREAMQSAKSLHEVKNGVALSNVLDSVLQTQVAQLAESIKRKSPAEFQKSYDETLGACNGCHTEAGYKFIHIVRPIAPPVTNQKSEMAHTR
jgi:hypothetical protein